METVRVRSVRARATGITPPSDMASDANVLAGTEHFAAHCASCHGAPGVPRGDIAAGLYPKPANLRDSAQRYTPGELFWIIKNGIKMSGMPSWNDHSDDELWATVAFIEKLPAMSDDDYRQLVMASLMHGGGRHSHGGMDDGKSNIVPMDHSSMSGMVPAQGDRGQH
jgi:mono/diheme cytochrome c family protein